MRSVNRGYFQTMCVHFIMACVFSCMFERRKETLFPPLGHGRPDKSLIYGWMLEDQAPLAVRLQSHDSCFCKRWGHEILQNERNVSLCVLRGGHKQTTNKCGDVTHISLNMRLLKPVEAGDHACVAAGRKAFFVKWTRLKCQEIDKNKTWQMSEFVVVNQQARPSPHSFTPQLNPPLPTAEAVGCCHL